MNIPPDQINISYNHRYQHDSRTLAECGIVANENVYSTLKLASGRPIRVTFPDGSETRVLIVPYQLIGHILVQLHLPSEEHRYVVVSRETGNILDQEEFCGHVINDLRAGIILL